MAHWVSCLPLTVDGTDSIPGQSVGFIADRVALKQALRALGYYLVNVITPTLHSHIHLLTTLDKKKHAAKA